MAKGDISPESGRSGQSGYPPPHDEKLKGRKTWQLTRQWKLTQFGVNRVELPPGAWSTNRHWHRNNDELVVVISGELVAVTDEGEEVLRAGDCIGFKAGVPNAHHLQNRSDRTCTFLAVSAGDDTAGGVYSDIDMLFGEAGYTHKDGTPYPGWPKETKE